MRGVTVKRIPSESVALDPEGNCLFGSPLRQNGSSRCYNALVDTQNLRAYKNYQWIVLDTAMLGGKPAIRGTRLSASLILACLAEGMSAEEIEESYGPFPREAIPEVLTELRLISKR